MNTHYRSYTLSDMLAALAGLAPGQTLVECTTEATRKRQIPRSGRRCKKSLLISARHKPCTLEQTHVRQHSFSESPLLGADPQIQQPATLHTVLLLRSLIKHDPLP